ncbi:nitrite reductase (NADH) small subunit [Arthrobacter pigmenti]|uniref:Nitrite reductase (NADH) small subunit n=1 Tax=Arthrobacter pigmenti TaxID=271432 RepID=A0A846RFE1_9MICC|nr:nitrite reductase small subunit NirD [Arthrobacter pigmenti]NJC21793.1 nitrite reductase (NADH) small subunit [Arthrobacter pigmenti]
MTLQLDFSPEPALQEGLQGTWYPICRLADLEQCWGEAALIHGRQVALFRVDTEAVFAVSHRDPVSGSQVMARGLVGSKRQRFTITSPLHKQVYYLDSGEPVSGTDTALRSFPTRIADGVVEVLVA